jgi:amino acid transporter, AAT family
MTTTLHATPGDSRRRTRTLPWYGHGLASLAVVCVLGLGSWYLFADPALGTAGSTYPQPLTAWMFWTIIVFVWLGFNLELSPFARLAQPWRGLAVAVATGGLGALITWALAAGWGAVDASFAATRAGGAGYALGSLIVLYSFVTYTMSAVNWGHWPWPGRGLRQPWLGLAEMAALAVPTLVLYLIFAVPALATWATPGSALLDANTQIGFFYCVVVSAILSGAVLGNWPWRLAGDGIRTVAASLAGNLLVGWLLYLGLGGVARVLLGAANVAAIGSSMPVYAAQVGVCWVFWMVMWSNAFGNRPGDARPAVALAARTLVTLLLAVLTFALYYHLLGGALFHEPASATGASVHGSALVGMDWLIIWALWYVVGAGSWGLPRPREAGAVPGFASDVPHPASEEPPVGAPATPGVTSTTA